jgi:GNAT superfamily N-acetyltransferase
MGALNIRTLDPEHELDAFLAVSNLAAIRPVTRERWLALAARAGGHSLRRSLVGESDGRIVAIAALADEWRAVDGVSALVVTDPAHRRQGHGLAMLAAVDEVLAERRPAQVWTSVRDDDAESRAWAERRGFVAFAHTFSSRLDLETFDPNPHRYAVERAEAAGLRFVRSRPDDDPDALYELFVRLAADAPDQLQPPDRAYFQREVVDRAGAITVLAYRGDEAVGLAVLVPREADEYGNALTGVLPEHRGRGLARALKVVSGEAAREAGRRYLVTGNNARNAPMLAVNDALGYVRQAGIVHLRRPRS